MADFRYSCRLGHGGAMRPWVGEGLQKCGTPPALQANHHTDVRGALFPFGSITVESGPAASGLRKRYVRKSLQPVLCTFVFQDLSPSKQECPWLVSPRKLATPGQQASFPARPKVPDFRSRYSYHGVATAEAEISSPSSGTK